MEHLENENKQKYRQQKLEESPWTPWSPVVKTSKSDGGVTEM